MTRQHTTSQQAHIHDLNFKKWHPLQGKENIPPHPCLPSTSLVPPELSKSKPVKPTRLSELKRHNKSLEAQVHEAAQEQVDDKEKLKELATELEWMSETLKKNEESLTFSRRAKESCYKQLRVARHSMQHTKASNATLRSKLNQCKAALVKSMREQDQLTAEITRLQKSVQEHDNIIFTLREKLRLSGKKKKALKMALGRAHVSQDKAHAKAKEAAIQASWNLVLKGVYTPQARALAHDLVKAGISQKHVGEVIYLIAKYTGLSVKGAMSHRTVGRAITEDGVAAKLQLAYELNGMKGFTASGDATSHKSTNYEAMHVTYIALNYDNLSHPSVPLTRLFAISSTVSHHSETQVQSWKKHISDICMHSDHASNQKKTVKLMLAWKTEVICMQLRWEHFETLSAAQLTEALTEVKIKCVDDAGGFAEWLKLDEEETATRYKAAMDALALKLGQEEYEKLPAAEKREIDTFFWAGCSMHKELNSVVSGYASCAKVSGDLGVEPPVMLANKDNDAMIKLAALSGSTSEAAECAVKASERGAVKLTQLAGSLFHHKDDKKGYQNQHHDYFQNTVIRRLRVHT
ncbi:uncharacterized protein ARMOST_19404 [Armillaria ostoyae]|uniref:Uncharacterized protein n=1 Tax=Armillaria ostoyae TaxID=47428 RepID=A0A284S4J9_ARMOS|nr:uncharacterized protein ARMOST_19404 [Armillaria ostoyae]